MLDTSKIRVEGKGEVNFKNIFMRTVDAGGQEACNAAMAWVKDSRE